MTYSPDTLKKFNFADADTYQQLLDLQRQDIISDNLTAQLKSIDFVKEWLVLNPDFANQQPEKYAEIQRRLHEVAWLAIPGSESDDVLELLQYHLLDLFNLQAHYELSEEDFGIIDKEVLTERVRKHLVTIKSFEERDAFKAKLVSALQQNAEVLTSAEFYSNIKAIPATTQNWLIEYDRYMGKEYSTFRESSWLAKNDNVKRLSSQEKDRLRTILKLYERLKISSFLPTGIEEVVPYEDAKGVGVLKYGEVEYYDPNELAETKQFVKDHKQLLLDSGYSQEEVDAITGARPPVEQVTPKPISATATTATGPDIEATKGPDHFTDKDQVEIDAHKALVASLVGQSGNYANTAHDIKTSLQLHFSTPDLEKKFTSLLVSVLRGLRDVMEFKTYLEELKYSTADIAAIIEAVSAELPQSKLKTNEALKSIEETQRYIAKQGQVARPAAQNQGTNAPQRVPTGDDGSNLENTKPTFLPKLRRSRSPKKPIIDDVKIQQSMVMGPVDELRAMDLIEFRRLAADPINAAMKLRDKVQLLGEESLLTQAEGIKAFRQSPLQQLYLDIGNQSIATGKSAAEVIADYGAQGKPALTMTEFTAVADLNKQMRF